MMLLLPLAAGAADGPKLVCDRPAFRFGTVEPSAVVAHVFTVRNEGNLTFFAGSVQTGCSCTAGRLDRRSIPPGETAELTAVFTAAGRKGLQKQRLRLYSAGEEEPVLTFYMEGLVESPARSH